MPAYNNYVGYAAFNPYQNTGLQIQYPQQNYIQQPTPNSDGLIYVHGIEGANAYQIPAGVSKVTLWDDTDDCFYVKGYDPTGKPRILAWNDYKAHVVEESTPAVAAPQIDTSQYLTRDEFNKILSELMVGERGRIVRNNEHDA